MMTLTRRTLLAAAAALPVAASPLAGLAADDPRLAEMTLGDAAAPVEIVEYASLTCPHCARFHADVLPRLKAEYIDTGKVRMVFREVYFDRYGLWAAMIARCGGPDRYFGIVGEVFRTQADWRKAADDAGVAANLRRIGRLAGLSDEQMNACMADQEFANSLVRTYQANATRDGIEATPTFLVNGEKVPNMAWDQFRTRIDAKIN